MLILLPIACWGTIFLVCVRREISRAAAFLTASVIWGVLLTFITELLSLFNALTQKWIGLIWGGLTLITITFFLRVATHKSHSSPEPHSRTDLVLAGAIIFLCLATLATALLYPPNNWDSMTYHMSRVVHWLQNRSVAHYPTHIMRQIELNPWAEFAITHFQALSGSDRFANTIQWFSMIGSIIGAALIARLLGAKYRGQLFAAILTATIPMGILQASSTQNDYVAAYWLLCFTWSGIRLNEEYSLRWALMTGASLGLAVLTKGTAYLFALPFLFWFSWGIIRGTPRRTVLFLVSIVIPVLLLNAGHYSRNWTLFANPLGSATNDFVNKEITTRNTLSNLMRNSAIQLSTPFEGANKSIEHGITAIHDFLGININDPGTTWPGTTFKIQKLIRHEDYSGNLLHAVLAAISLGVVFCWKSLRQTSARILPYSLCVTSGFLLFCLILKWQPWNIRLHLPLFVMGAPVIGLVLGKLRQQILAGAVATLLIVTSVPWALRNISRPLLPPPKAIIDRLVKGKPLPLTILTAERSPQYFTNRQELWQPYSFVTNLIRTSGARNIGLKLSNEEAWEYPLWVLLNNEDGRGTHIEHIDVKNPSGVLSPVDFHPDLTVKFDNAGYPVILWSYKPKPD